MRALLNFCSYVQAVQRLPEFQGYKGKILNFDSLLFKNIIIVFKGQKFPGQLKPRHPEIIPRSMDIRPRIEDEEWRKIGFRRRKSFDIFNSDLQRAKIPTPRIITVAPSCEWSLTCFI